MKAEMRRLALEQRREERVQQAHAERIERVLARAASLRQEVEQHQRVGNNESLLSERRKVPPTLHEVRCLQCGGCAGYSANGRLVTDPRNPDALETIGRRTRCARCHGNLETDFGTSYEGIVLDDPIGGHTASIVTRTVH
jgi:hypothetical protein